jgi:3-oxosteroid 1-dehydrogenase
LSNLIRSVGLFNDYCDIGKDSGYQRGESAYDRLYNDPKVKLNPNLGKVNRPPYYALKVYPSPGATIGATATFGYIAARSLPAP